MDRRELLGLLTCSLVAESCFCCSAAARPALIGCLTADGRLTQDDIKQWRQHHEDKKVDSQFTLSGQDFGLPISTAIAFYLDERPNAYAVPIVWRPDRPDGTVAFGMNFARALTSTNSLLIPQIKHADNAYLIVLAHEMSHILQFKRRLTGPSVQMETHADFMAGWGFAQFERLRSIGDKLGFGIHHMAETMFSIGDTLFNNPTHHGEPHFRAAMVRAGSDAQGST